MNLNNIEKRFSTFLDKHWKLSDIAPFLLVYIRLLLLFKDELLPLELNVLLERQKQLRGESYCESGFEEVRSLSLKELNKGLENACPTRKEQLYRLLFCALLDEEENDFFYLTEPLFEFVLGMDVSLVQLTQILESEFDGFKI